MPDTKITALAAITTVAPANDLFAIVDVSDNSMAASGTTKNITTNQILGAGGTATLASATITGNLTVDTSTLKVDSSNDRVGIGTASPAVRMELSVADTAEGARFTASSAWLRMFPYLDATDKTKIQAVNGTNTALSDLTLEGLNLRFNTNAGLAYTISNTGVSTWQNVGGVAGTAMTLNSTGLGVGVSSPDFKFVVNGTQAVPSTSGSSATDGSLRIGAPGTGLVIDTGVTAASAVYGWIQARARTDYSSNFNLVLQPNGGNVGIGVTPSAWGSNSKALQVGGGTASVSSTGAGSTASRFAHGAYFDNTNWLYQYTGVGPALYQVTGANAGSTHAWYTSAGGTAGNTITDFATAKMTLDASGNLLVGKTAAGFGTVGNEVKGNGEVFSTQSSSSNAATTYHVYSTAAAAYRFYVGLGGTVYATNTTISAISDARLKENVQDIDVGLGAILALKPRKFDWKAGKGKDIKGDRGFIAQEFETVFPNLIDEWKDNAPEGEAPYKSVRQDLIPVLVKAIQELTARVQTLEAR